MMMKKTVHRICAATCALASLAFLAAAPAAHAADAPVTSPTTPARPAKSGPKQAARPLADRLQAICSAADLNHDGNVSLDEFHQDIVQSWHSLGPDAQGYVHLAQLGQVPRIGKGALRRWCVVSRPLTWAAMRMPKLFRTSGMLPRRSAPTSSAFMESPC